MYVCINLFWNNPAQYLFMTTKPTDRCIVQSRPTMPTGFNYYGLWFWLLASKGSIIVVIDNKNMR